MTLTKAIIAEKLSKELQLNKQDAKNFVEIFFENIKHLLEQGHNVKLSGFGNFNLRDKVDRPGRNPRTNEIIPVVARRVVTFRAGQKLRGHLKERDAN